MIPSHTVHDCLQRAFTPTQHGIVGLTEQLLGACVGADVEFKRVGDRCVCRWTGSGDTQDAPVPLPPAAFRTILARIAVLCNENSPNSVTPYGGEGLLTVNGSPSAVFHVAFINTPGEQRLEVRHEWGHKAELVRSTLRQWHGNHPDEDDCTRTFLSLGAESMAAIRDPTYWPTFEPLIVQDVAACALLNIGGASLAQHWLSSPRPRLAGMALRWLLSHWRECWGSLNDRTKRVLVEHFAEQAALKEATAKGVAELPRLITSVLARFEK